MSARRPIAVEVPRVALNVEEACAALGVSWDFWKAHIEPEVPIVRLGARKLIAVDALRAWLADKGEQTLSDRRASR